MKPFQIRRDCLAYLDGPSFAALEADGRCSWTWPAQWNNSQPRQAPDITTTCLALDASRSYYWFDSEAEGDLVLLLDSARLVRYIASASTLELTESPSLRNILDERCALETTHTVSERRALPTKGARDEYDNWFTDAAVAAWADGRTFFGQLAVCSCDEAGCGATYAWLERERCLLLVEVSAAGIYQIELGPFALKR